MSVGGTGVRTRDLLLFEGTGEETDVESILTRGGMRCLGKRSESVPDSADLLARIY